MRRLPRVTAKAQSRNAQAAVVATCAPLRAVTECEAAGYFGPSGRITASMT